MLYFIKCNHNLTSAVGIFCFTECLKMWCHLENLGLIVMLMHCCFSSSIDKNFATHKNMKHITYILEAYCFLLTCQFASEMLCIVSSTFMTTESVLVVQVLLRMYKHCEEYVCMYVTIPLQAVENHHEIQACT